MARRPRPRTPGPTAPAQPRGAARLHRRAPGRVGKREIARSSASARTQARPARSARRPEPRGRHRPRRPPPLRTARPPAGRHRRAHHRHGRRRRRHRPPGGLDRRRPAAADPHAPGAPRPARPGPRRARARPPQPDRRRQVRGPHPQAPRRTRPAASSASSARAGGGAWCRPTAGPRPSGASRPARTPAPRTARSCVATPLPDGGAGLKPARITERLGRMGDARSVSLICIHTHDIPHDFSADALPPPSAPARARWAGARTCATSARHHRRRGRPRLRRRRLRRAATATASA